MKTPKTIQVTDLPNLATHRKQEECGLSVYRGVLVQWDEDQDTRILGVIDKMPASVVDRLLVTQKHEGIISFVWDGPVPHGYEAGKDVVAFDEEGEDYWIIHTSHSL